MKEWPRIKIRSGAIYTITAKPIKMLELRYPMIQFLIMQDIHWLSNQSESAKNTIHCFSIYEKK